MDCEFNGIKLASLICCCVLTSCATVSSDHTETISIEALFENKSSYNGRDVCITGYADFDRLVPRIVQGIDEKPAKSERVVVPKDFDIQQFIDTEDQIEIERTAVKACGILTFNEECFAKNSGVLCVPKRLHLRKSTMTKLQ